MQNITCSSAGNNEKLPMHCLYAQTLLQLCYICWCKADCR